MTTIEKALFQNERVHWVNAIDWPRDGLVLELHPFQHPESITQARFERVSLVSMDDAHAGEDRWFPWDIIGFDAEPLSDGLWRFCLHTDCVEYVFDAAWPQITKPSTPV